MVTPKRDGVCNPVAYVLCMGRSSNVAVGVENPDWLRSFHGTKHTVLTTPEKPAHAQARVFSSKYLPQFLQQTGTVCLLSRANRCG